MPVKVGDLALGGEWEEINIKCFDIMEDMVMEFKGKSCNIKDSTGEFVMQYNENQEIVRAEVFVGYQCYVMEAKVKFTKKL